MFAGAAREVVFANPHVVRRINERFIPIALKAAQVENPPPGLEGQLYGEIARTRPAPQGICTMDSTGQVLSWALSFDDNPSILGFLDHVEQRYRRAVNSKDLGEVDRFRSFPSQPLRGIPRLQKPWSIPHHHAAGERCPAAPVVAQGALAGKVVGRPLDKTGAPIAATLRQEEYMEARFEMALSEQWNLLEALKRSGGSTFELPDAVARSIVAPAYLGQLDVAPLASRPDVRPVRKEWRLRATPLPSDAPSAQRIRIEGWSDVEAREHDWRRARDGARWEHRVALRWQGYATIKGGKLIALQMLGEGRERLRWGSPTLMRTQEPDAAHLMAGHPIDLNAKVRYAIGAAKAANDRAANEKAVDEKAADDQNSKPSTAKPESR